MKHRDFLLIFILQLFYKLNFDTAFLVGFLCELELHTLQNSNTVNKSLQNLRLIKY